MTTSSHKGRRVKANQDVDLSLASTVPTSNRRILNPLESGRQPHVPLRCHRASSWRFQVFSVGRGRKTVNRNLRVSTLKTKTKNPPYLNFCNVSWVNQRTYIKEPHQQEDFVFVNWSFGVPFLPSTVLWGEANTEDRQERTYSVTGVENKNENKVHGVEQKDLKGFENIRLLFLVW